MGRIKAGRTCRACRKKSDVFAFFSPYLYQNEIIRGLIHKLKYQRAEEIHRVLAGLLARSLAYFSFGLPPQAIMVPIPLYPSRERVRGFNQARLISQELSAALGLVHAPDMLHKIKKTAAQMALSGEERRSNVVGAFGLSPAFSQKAGIDPQLRLKDKIIILVDDVKTTGATLREAAKTLKQSGAKQIWAITVAH